MDGNGTVVVEYTYDAWGKLKSMTGSKASTVGKYNPIRYRGYVYDTETQLYYLNTRYYNPDMGRFINADSYADTGDELLGSNMFAYCGNNPVNRSDPNGEGWIHWVVAAAVVVVAAAATVITCGGLAPAAYAVSAVACGMAATTTAATVSAAVFVGSATVFTGMAITAAASSHSADEFAAWGDWRSVIAIAGGAVFNGAVAYAATRTLTTTVYRSVSSAEAQDIKNTGQFNLSPRGMDSKQFGFNLSETRQF